MITYSQSLSLYQTYTKNTSATNQTLGATLYNDSLRTICSINGGKWPFLETEEIVRTIADREYVTIPNNIRKVMSFRYVQGTDPNTDANVIPRMIFDSSAWERVLQARLGSSSWPYFAYQKDRRLVFRPIPSTDDNLIAVRGRLNVTDLSIADYSTGSIVSVPYTQSLTGTLADGAVTGTLTSNWSLPTGLYTVTFDNENERVVLLTNGSPSMAWTTPLTSAVGITVTVGAQDGGSIITATGTTFTADMVGRWIRITQATAANQGDGAWYEIGDYYSATSIGLKTAYQGSPIVAGTAPYVIGQVSPLPEAYQMAPIYRACALYWGINNPNTPNTNLANYYWRLYDGGVEAGLSQSYGGIIGQMQEEANESQEGPYMGPLPRKGESSYGLPFYNPFQQASGL